MSKQQHKVKARQVTAAQAQAAQAHTVSSVALPAPQSRAADGAQVGPFAALRAAVSTLLARAGLAGRAGITFGGARDLYTALGYKRDLLPEDYRARHKRGDIAARIIEAKPEATWRGGGELVEDEDPKVETAFEAAWNALERKHHIWATFARTDKLAGIGRYAILVIGMPGDLNMPAEKAHGPEDLLYLQPYAEDDASIAQFDADPTSARYGLPTDYLIQRTDPNSINKAKSGSAHAHHVHWSRVIHIADGALDDLVFGAPRLERVWNRLDDLDKIAGGGAEAFWQRAHQGYQFDIDKEAQPSDKELARLEDEVSEYMHGMRRALRTQGVAVNTFGSDVADIEKPLNALVSLISASTGIPQRILMGSERGELASTQDKTNWDERITDRRTEFAGPFVVRALVDRLIEYGILPAPAAGGYDVRWPQIANMTEEQRAKVAVAYAEVNQKAGETVIYPDEIRDRVLQLPPRAEVEGNDLPEEGDTTEEDDAATDDGEGGGDEGAGAAGAEA